MAAEVWTGKTGAIETHHTHFLSMNTLHPPVNLVGPPPPTILTIPNEILLHILSFVPSHPFNNASLDNHDSVSQMLALRSVCRHLRAITLELYFWYESEFQFRQFIPSSSLPRDIDPNHPAGISLRHAQEARFLKVLFNDKRFVDCLGRRKTEWTFESIDVLETVMQCIPLFRENARTICLEISEQAEEDFEYSRSDDDEDEDDSDSEPRRSTILDTAISRLSSCNHIAELTIHGGYYLSLNNIASCLPHLETLYCLDINHFRGSLAQLHHLQDLEMDLR